MDLMEEYSSCIRHRARVYYNYRSMVEVLDARAGASHFTYPGLPDPETPVFQAGNRGLEKSWSPSRESETILALGRKTHGAQPR